MLGNYCDVEVPSGRRKHAKGLKEGSRPEKGGGQEKEGEWWRSVGGAQILQDSAGYFKIWLLSLRAMDPWRDFNWRGAMIRFIFYTAFSGLLFPATVE